MDVKTMLCDYRVVVHLIVDFIVFIVFIILLLLHSNEIYYDVI